MAPRHPLSLARPRRPHAYLVHPPPRLRPPPLPPRPCPQPCPARARPKFSSLPARFSGTFWLSFWSQQWGHIFWDRYYDLYHGFQNWGRPVTPKTEPKSWEFFGRNWAFCVGLRAIFEGRLLGNARSPGSWLREGQCPGATEPVMLPCGLIRLWAQNVSAQLLVEFSADVAPQPSLKCCFQHMCTLGLPGVRDYLCLASATVVVWAQHFGPKTGDTVETCRYMSASPKKSPKTGPNFWGTMRANLKVYL